MVGKIKHVRQKLHQEAVKLHSPDSSEQKLPAPQPQDTKQPSCVETSQSRAGKQILAKSSFSSKVFDGIQISKESLVQTLSFKEESAPHVTPPAKKGPGEVKLISKKEKMKERRDKWLRKISSIKLAKEQQAAEARRQATPVVGDLRPLADALPDLCQLMSPAVSALSARRKSRKNKMPLKRTKPTDFSQMKQSQKRKLLEEESSRFCDAVKMFSSRKNPLADVGELLKKRMKQEEEQDPS